MQPPIDGFAVSRAANTLAPKPAPAPASLAHTPANLTNPLLWGIGAALLYSFYMYRRVL